MMRFNPTPELEIAIRTGFISKKIWLDYFVDKSNVWQNQKWALFVKRGYFKPHHSERASDVIVPNPDNNFVKGLAGDFISPAPSIAVIGHDEKVLRTYLMMKEAEVLELAKFEPELKKEDQRDKRHFDPSDATKFPDLLIALKGPSSQRRIAIELELSRKEPKRYRQMMNSYMTKKDVSAIVVVTDLEVVKNGIQTAIRETYYPDWDKPVGFASLRDWMVNPMTATIKCSDGDTSLEVIRTGKSKNQHGATPSR